MEHAMVARDTRQVGTKQSTTLPASPNVSMINDFVKVKAYGDILVLKINGDKIGTLALETANAGDRTKGFCAILSAFAGKNRIILDLSEAKERPGDYFQMGLCSLISKLRLIPAELPVIVGAEGNMRNELRGNCLIGRANAVLQSFKTLSAALKHLGCRDSKQNPELAAEAVQDAGRRMIVHE